MHDCVGKIEYGYMQFSCDSNMVLGRSLVLGSMDRSPGTLFLKVLRDTEYSVPGWLTLLLAHNSSDRGHAQQTEVFYLTTPSVAKTK
jgi:hypothetical protein